MCWPLPVKEDRQEDAGRPPIERHLDRRMDKWRNRLMAGQMYELDSRTGRQTDRQTGRQAGRPPQHL